MFKLGDRVCVDLQDERCCGVVCDVDEKHGAVSVAIGEYRVAQVRACDCSYDDGDKALKQEKYVDNTNYDNYGGIEYD